MKEYNGFIELTKKEYENMKKLKDSDYFHSRHIENAENGKLYIYVHKDKL